MPIKKNDLDSILYYEDEEFVQGYTDEPNGHLDVDRLLIDPEHCWLTQTSVFHRGKRKIILTDFSLFIGPDTINDRKLELLSQLLEQDFDIYATTSIGLKKLSNTPPFIHGKTIVPLSKREAITLAAESIGIPLSQLFILDYFTFNQWTEFESDANNTINYLKTNDLKSFLRSKKNIDLFLKNLPHESLHIQFDTPDSSFDYDIAQRLHTTHSSSVVGIKISDIVLLELLQQQKFFPQLKTFQYTLPRNYIRPNLSKMKNDYHPCRVAYPFLEELSLPYDVDPTPEELSTIQYSSYPSLKRLKLTSDIRLRKLHENPNFVTLLESNPNLTTLFLSGSNVQWDFPHYFKVTKSFSSLTKIIISDISLSKYTLFSLLKASPQLSALRLINTKISDVSYIAKDLLPSLPSLTHLDLSDSTLPAAIVDALLDACPHLIQLNLSIGSITHGNLRQHSLQKLTTLSSTIPIDDAILSLSPYITDIEYQIPNLLEVFNTRLLQNNHLKTLTLETSSNSNIVDMINPTFSKNPPPSLSALERLKIMDINQPLINQSHFYINAILTSCPLLNTLQLANIQIIDDITVNKDSLPALENIILTSTVMTYDSLFVLLRASKTIKKIYLSNVLMYNMMRHENRFAHLLDATVFTQLTKLVIHQSGSLPQLLLEPLLKASPQLTILEFSELTLDDNDTSHLPLNKNSLPKLNTLTLDKVILTTNSLLSLLEASPNLITLSLSISSGDAFKDDLKLEKNYFLYLSRLTLTLNADSLLDTKSHITASHLTSLIEASPNVTELILNKCTLHGCWVLEKNSLSSLTKLNLNEVNLSSECLSVLLHTCPHLKELKLNNCEISGEMSNVLNTLTSLTTLIIWGTKLQKSILKSVKPNCFANLTKSEIIQSPLPVTSLETLLLASPKIKNLNIDPHFVWGKNLFFRYFHTQIKKLEITLPSAQFLNELIDLLKRFPSLEVFKVSVLQENSVILSPNIIQQILNALPRTLKEITLPEENNGRMVNNITQVAPFNNLKKANIGLASFSRIASSISTVTHLTIHFSRHYMAVFNPQLINSLEMFTQLNILTLHCKIDSSTLNQIKKKYPTLLIKTHSDLVYAQSLEKNASPTCHASSSRSMDIDTQDKKTIFTISQYFLSKSSSSIDARLLRLNVNTEINLDTGELGKGQDFKYESQKTLPATETWTLRKKYDETYIHTSNIYYGQVRFPAYWTEWIALPSLNPYETILEMESNANLEFMYSEKLSLTFVRPKQLCPDPIMICFLLDVDPNHQYRIDDLPQQACFIKGPHIIPGVRNWIEYFKALTFNNDGTLLFPKHWSEQTQQLVSLRETNPLELINIAHYYAYYFSCGAVTDTPNDPSTIDKLNILLKQRKGACRHRSDLLLHLLNSLGIPTREAISDCHAFIEVYIKPSQEAPEQWFSLDLGGYASDININELLPDLPHLSDAEENIISLQAAIMTMVNPIEPSFVMANQITIENNRFAKLYHIAKRQDPPEYLWQTIDEECKSLEPNRRNVLLILDNKEAALPFYYATQKELTKKGIGHFYIHHLDDIHRHSMCINDEIIITDSELIKFIKNSSPNSVLIVNWMQCKASNMGYNSLMDSQGRKLFDIFLKKGIKVITLITRAQLKQFSEEFISRHGPKMAYSYLLEQENTDTSISSATIPSVELYEDKFNWKNQLIGKLSFDNQKPIFKPGALLQAIKEKAPGLHIINPPQTEEFELWWYHLIQSRQLWHNDNYLDLPKDFIITKQTKPYHYDEPLLISTVDMPDFSQIDYPLNLETWRYLFPYDHCQQNSLSPIPGWLARQANKEIHLLVTDSLNEHQWGKLIDEARQFHCTLRWSIIKNVTIPSCIPTQITASKKENDSENIATKIIISNDLDTVEKKLLSLEKLPDEIKIIDITEDTTFNYLFGRIKITARSINSAQMLSFSFQSTDLGRELEKDGTIIFKGRPSKKLAAELETLFTRNPFVWINGTQQPVKAKIIFLTHDNTLFPFAPRQQDNISEKEKGRPENCSSKQKENGLILEKRYHKIYKTLQTSATILVSGINDIGFSRLNADFNEYLNKQHPGIQCFTGMNKIDEWIKFSDATTKILFINRNELEKNHALTLLEGFSHQHPMLFYHDKFHFLSERHKVVIIESTTQPQHTTDFFKHHGRIIHCKPVGKEDLLFSLLKTLCPCLSDQVIHGVVQLFLIQYQQWQHHDKLTHPLIEQNLQMICWRFAASVLNHRDFFKQLSQESLNNSDLPADIVLAAQFAIYDEMKGHFKLEHRKHRKEIKSDLAIGSLYKQYKTLRMGPINDQLNHFPGCFKPTKSRHALLRDLTDQLEMCQLQKQYPKIFFNGTHGMMIEGKSGIGKSTTVVEYLKSFGYVDALRSDANKQNLKKKYYHLSASNPEYLEKMIQQAFDEGAVMIVDEMNTLSISFIEPYLKGTDAHGNPPKQPGFLLIDTQNPISFAHRKPIPSELLPYLAFTPLKEYSEEELIEIYQFLHPKAKRDDAEKLVKEYLDYKDFADSTSALRPTSRDMFNM
ncbi:MAG TPA: hypothetical protein VJN02_07030 [Gammaproteobacteria bacterium]|nr:hypothetical protein [Gammaproteobacteria bacterium]